MARPATLRDSAVDTITDVMVLHPQGTIIVAPLQPLVMDVDVLLLVTMEVEGTMIMADTVEDVAIRDHQTVDMVDTVAVPLLTPWEVEVATVDALLLLTTAMVDVAVHLAPMGKFRLLLICRCCSRLGLLYFCCCSVHYDPLYPSLL